ncbi:MAG: hypothetical protein NTY09_05795 [bacterium]|nr:hypothetical protein [bacterium]
MGINEIHDGRDSLLTHRLEKLQRVQKREGDGGGGGASEFQQIFDYNEKEEKDQEKDKDAKSDDFEHSEALPFATPPRVIIPEDNKPNHKKDKLAPGALIDVEG